MAFKQSSQRRGNKPPVQPFLSIPWGNEQDAAFDEWLTDKGKGMTPAAVLAWAMEQGYAVKVAANNDGFFCSLEHLERKDKDLPFMLSGWGGDYKEAMQVAHFKVAVILEDDWDKGGQSRSSSRRR